MCLCPFSQQDFLLNVLLRCLSCFHYTASTDQKEAACFNSQDFAQSSKGSSSSIDWSYQGSRHLHITPPHQGKLMQVHWPWFLGIVLLSPAHRPKIRLPLCLYYIIVCNSLKSGISNVCREEREGEGEMESCVSEIVLMSTAPSLNKLLKATPTAVICVLKPRECMV